MATPVEDEQAAEIINMRSLTRRERTIDRVRVSAEAPAPDLVKQLLFRSSDEAGIGWTPNTVVHVPAGLLHNAADEITRLTAENERMRAALEQIEYLDRPQSRGLPRRVSIQEIARAALQEPRT